MNQQPLTLTRPQKAAAILVAMGKPSASRLLKFFKQEELKALIEGARLLRTIPQADLDRIVAEFEAEFTEGAGLLDSADEMDTILNESLSPEEMNAIMNGTPQEAVQEKAPPIWPELEKLDPDRLGAFLAGEHAQTSAMVLSKLSPQAAANVLLSSALALEPEDLATRRAHARELDTAASSVDDLRHVHAINGGNGGYLRYAVRDLSGRRSADATLGIARPYPVTMAEQVELAPVLAKAEPPTPGAVELRDTLFTLPTHRFVDARDISALSRWIAAGKITPFPADDLLAARGQ